MVTLQDSTIMSPPVLQMRTLRRRELGELPKVPKGAKPGSAESANCTVVLPATLLPCPPYKSYLSHVGKGLDLNTVEGPGVHMAFSAAPQHLEEVASDTATRMLAGHLSALFTAASLLLDPQLPSHSQPRLSLWFVNRFGVLPIFIQSVSLCCCSSSFLSIPLRDYYPKN